MELLCANVFAEFIVAPTIGFSNLHSAGKHTTTVSGGYGTTTKTTENTLSWTPFSFGTSLGAITRNGFTFLASSDFLTGNTMDFKSEIAGIDPIKGSVKLGGICFQGNLLLGYTYRGIKNLFLTFASGLGAGGGMLKVTEISSLGRTMSGLNIDLREANVGIPFYLGASYFFTERMGINVGILDTVGAGWVWYKSSELGGLLHRILEPAVILSNRLLQMYFR